MQIKSSLRKLKAMPAYAAMAFFMFVISSVGIASDAVDTVQTSTTFRVTDSQPVAPPQVNLTSPADASVVTAPSAVVGAVQDTADVTWQLTAQALDGRSAVITLASGDAPAEGTLATFDPTLLLNGQYRLQLTALNSFGAAQAERVVIVDGKMKVGQFAFTVEDVNISMQGLPATVWRSYDTRRKATSGDFGYEKLGSE